MSDTHNTLLPISSIGVFVKNKQLQDDVRHLRDDWRFPRVHIDVTQGDVTSALELYKTQSAHDLIMIETDTIDESFSEQLEALSAYCTQDTAAIIIGPVNDVNLYRKLMAMGVSDYLVHPIKKEALGDVIASALIERLGTAKSRLVTVMGAKGGVGTSSIAQALALGCSETLGQKTLLLDAAGGASYLSVALGGEPITTLKEAARASLADDEGSMKRMLVQINDTLELIGSGGEPLLEDPIQADSFESMLDVVMHSFPIVVFDASSASLSIQRALLARSHKIYLLTTPTLSSLRTARTLIQEIKNLRGGLDEPSLIDLTLNMKGIYAKQEISKTEAEKALEHEIAHVIDFDPTLFPAAEIDGQKITERKNSETLINPLLEGMKELIGGGQHVSAVAEKTGVLDRFLGLKSKMKSKKG